MRFLLWYQACGLLIRVQEETRGDRGLREETTAPPRIETLSGRVQSVNSRDSNLESPPNKSVVVALLENVRESDRERFKIFDPAITSGSREDLPAVTVLKC